MSLGNRIRSLRKELGLSQDEFAAKINMHGRQLGRYETGKSKPSLGALAKLAQFCEISIDYLVFGKDEKLARRAKINDPELLDLLRQVDRLRKPQREKIKWAIKALINNQ